MVHDLKRVTEQGGSPGTAQPDPLSAAENPRTRSALGLVTLPNASG